MIRTSWLLPGIIAASTNTNCGGVQKNQRDCSWFQYGVVVCVQLERAQDASLTAACQSGQLLPQVLPRQWTLRSGRDSKVKLLNSGRIGLGHHGSQIVAVVLVRFPTVNSWPCPLQLRLQQPLSSKSRGKGRKGKGGGKGGKKVIRRGSLEIFSMALEKSKTCYTVGATIPSVSISRKVCVQREPNARGSIASNRRSIACPEKRFRSALRWIQLRCQFPQSPHL